MNYSLTSPKWEGEIRLEYHDNGYLKSATLPEVFDVNAAMYFATHFPIYINLIDWYRKNTSSKITEIAVPITFDVFWQAYDQKRGSKELSRQYWEGEKRTLNKRPINDTDRLLIMNILKRYTARYKGDKKEFQPLASSFLHGRMWEAEAEATPKRNEAANEHASSLLNKWKERTNNQ